MGRLLLCFLLVICSGCKLETPKSSGCTFTLGKLETCQGMVQRYREDFKSFTRSARECDKRIRTCTSACKTAIDVLKARCAALNTVRKTPPLPTGTPDIASIPGGLHYKLMRQHAEESALYLAVPMDGTHTFMCMRQVYCTEAKPEGSEKK